MALNTYSTIKDATLRWLNREGFTALEDDIEDLMAIAQRSIWRTANLNAMLTATTLAVDARIEAAPSGMLRIKSITLQEGSQSKDLRGTDFRTVMLARDVDTPRYYTSVGTNLYFGPTPDQEYTLDIIGYAALTNVSTANDTNWVSDNYPELIMWSTMYEALLFLKDDNRAAVWKAKYDTLLDEILESERELQHEGGSLSVKDPNRIQGGVSL